MKRRKIIIEWRKRDVNYLVKEWEVNYLMKIKRKVKYLMKRGGSNYLINREDL